MGGGNGGPSVSLWAKPDVVPDMSSSGSSRLELGDSIARLEDVTLEPRQSDDSLDTPSKMRYANTSTPSWTEGTPSYTESSYSGETPVKKKHASSEQTNRQNSMSEQTDSFQTRADSIQTHLDTHESTESVVTKL